MARNPTLAGPRHPGLRPQHRGAGDQLAGAITYFGFLSFFPLLALGFSVVGYISYVYPSAQAE